MEKIVLHHSATEAWSFSQDTPLHIAVLEKQRQLVEYLVEVGAELNAKNTVRATPLHLAVDGGVGGGGGGGDVNKSGSPPFKVRVSRATPQGRNNSQEGEARRIAAIFGKIVGRCDRFDIAQYLIENGADLSARAYNGDTILHLAARAGCSLRVVEYLVEKGAEIVARNNEGLTPSQLTPAGGELYEYLRVREIITTMNQSSSSVSKTEITASNAGKVATSNMNYQNLSLFEAIKMGNLEAVRARVSIGGDNVTSWSRNGSPPIHIAAALGSLPILQYLVESARISVDARNRYGYTPLHLAAYYSHLPVMRYLVGRKGANVSAASNGGRTILQQAALSKSKQSVLSLRYLVKQGAAAVNATNDLGSTALHFASFANQLPAVAYLLKVGGAENIHLRNKAGDTPLHCACNRREVDDGGDLMKYLVRKGADVNARNRKGQTPLHLAAQWTRLRTIKFLIENGVDVSAKDEAGNTPLHSMASNNYLFNEKAVKALLEAGADLNARNGENKTPWGLSHVATEVEEYLANPGI